MGQSVRGRTMILSRHKAKAVWLNVFIRLLNLFEDGSFIEDLFELLNDYKCIYNNLIG